MVDWSRWMTMTAAQQEALRVAYREQLAKERDANRARWGKMTAAEKAKYPEAR
jgi:hypothetical protein